MDRCTVENGYICNNQTKFDYSPPTLNISIAGDILYTLRFQLHITVIYIIAIGTNDPHSICACLWLS